MGKPIASISVPEQDKEVFKEALPTLLADVGEDKPMKLSKLVQNIVLHSVVVDKQGLQDFASKENITTRNKYLILILG